MRKQSKYYWSSALFPFDTISCTDLPLYLLSVGLNNERGESAQFEEEPASEEQVLTHVGMLGKLGPVLASSIVGHS